ncbi:MAG: peptidase MA family metallohydrolase [Dehalococcoidia bacterium]
MPTKKLLSAPSLIAAALAVLMVLSGSPAGAQSGPTVTDGVTESVFPDGIQFRVTAESDADIEEIRLRYEILPDGTAANAVPDFEPSTRVEAGFILDVYLAPGTIIEYHWQVTDAEGNTAKTETKSFVYDDVRFEWAAAEGDGVTIYYYSGSEGDAQSMHRVAVQALDEMSVLLDAEIPFDVHVWIYESVDDMRPALARRSESYESRVITAGVRVATNTVLVLGNVSFDTLRHELTHVVTAQAGESALGTLPAWLDEGTAVYGQDDPGGFQDAVERAFARGNVLSVREITAYPGDPQKVDLFYGEGWSLVSYLVETYGEAKFAQLFAEVKSGERIDGALETVYGFDQDGLEDEWREANDLPARETQEPESQETDAPSVVPKTDDGGSSIVMILIIVGIILTLAAGVGGLGIVLARKL